MISNFIKGLILNFFIFLLRNGSYLAHPTNIILFEGILALYDPRITNLMTFKIFVSCDDDVRLCRRS